MSKKKRKATKDDVVKELAVFNRKLNEVINLLHVLVDQTKKPDPAGPVLKFGYTRPMSEEDMAQRLEDQQAWEQDLRRYTGPLLKKEPGDWHRNPRSRAAEEVEDYHGRAVTITGGGGGSNPDTPGTAAGGDRYAPVRIHQ